jgi:hypothetical protein
MTAVERAVAHRTPSQTHVTHVTQRDRFGDCVIDHVERVVAAVPTDARATSLLHDLLELCPTWSVIAALAHNLPRRTTLIGLPTAPVQTAAARRPISWQSPGA